MPSGHDGQRLDDIIVGHTGLNLEVAVLDLTRLAAVLDILLEQPVILDNTCIFQLGGNAGDGGSFRHGDGLGRAQRALAVQLRIELADLVAAKTHQRQKNEHNQAAKRETALARLFFVVLILVIFFVLGFLFGLFLFRFGRLLLVRFTLGGRFGGRRRSLGLCLRLLHRGLIRVGTIDPHGILLTF